MPLGPSEICRGLSVVTFDRRDCSVFEQQIDHRHHSGRRGPHERSIPSSLFWVRPDTRFQQDSNQVDRARRNRTMNRRNGAGICGWLIAVGSMLQQKSSALLLLEEAGEVKRAESIARRRVGLGGITFDPSGKTCRISDRGRLEPIERRTPANLIDPLGNSEQTVIHRGQQKRDAFGRYGGSESGIRLELSQDTILIPSGQAQKEILGTQRIPRPSADKPAADKTRPKNTLSTNTSRRGLTWPQTYLATMLTMRFGT